MKVVILAGGLSTRLSEQTMPTPKPMVEIGGKPILWHIMKIYSFYGLWEREPVEQIAHESQMEAYFHNDFWHPMDTLPHKNYLETLWSSGKAPWKIW